MGRQASKKSAGSDDYAHEGFALALSRDEARRQVRACAALCGFIFAALLASVLSGTS